MVYSLSRSAPDVKSARIARVILCSASLYHQLVSWTCTPSKYPQDISELSCSYFVNPSRKQTINPGSTAGGTPSRIMRTRNEASGKRGRSSSQHCCNATAALTSHYLLRSVGKAKKKTKSPRKTIIFVIVIFFLQDCTIGAHHWHSMLRLVRVDVEDII